MTARRKFVSRSGFTLIELLIALTILSVLSYLSYRGISALLLAEKRLEEGAKRMQMIDRFFSEFENDILFAVPRPVRISSTEIEPALRAAPVGTQGDYRINLSRFASAPDVPPQRVGYIFSMPTISMAATATMDYALAADEQSAMLVDGLQSASVRFLDADGRWSDNWPPVATASMLPNTLPKAVEIILVLNDIGTVTRLIARP
jgi:general secretion pathway protein J